MATIMRDAGCSDVKTEPALLPVNPNDFSSRSNTTEGARLDISARGLKSSFERTFYDVRVYHPYAKSNVTVSFSKISRNEKEKRDLYEGGCHCPFCPFHDEKSNGHGQNRHNGQNRHRNGQNGHKKGQNGHKM